MAKDKEKEESEIQEEKEESEEDQENNDDFDRDIWHADEGPDFFSISSGNTAPSLESMPITDNPAPNLEQQIQSSPSTNSSDESENNQPTYTSSYQNAAYAHASFEGSNEDLRPKDSQINIMPALPIHRQPEFSPQGHNISLGSWQQQAMGIQSDQDDYETLGKFEKTEQDTRRGLGRKR